MSGDVRIHTAQVRYRTAVTTRDGAPILTVYIDLSEVGRVFGGPPRGNEHWTTDLHWLMTDRASEVSGADRAKCMVYSERMGRPFTSATDEAVIP